MKSIEAFTPFTWFILKNIFSHKLRSLEEWILDIQVKMNIHNVCKWRKEINRTDLDL